VDLESAGEGGRERERGRLAAYDDGAYVVHEIGRSGERERGTDWRRTMTGHTRCTRLGERGRGNHWWRTTTKRTRCTGREREKDEADYWIMNKSLLKDIRERGGYGVYIAI
jgi:hypothetical protein